LLPRLLYQATLSLGGFMTKEWFERETNFALAMAAARGMLQREIIDQKDFRKIETIFRRKYRPIINGQKA